MQADSQAVAPLSGAAPAWIAYAGFVVSVVLAIIKLIEFGRTLRVSTTLSLSLTRDVFFRFGEFGETLFINSVMFATDRPALLQSARATLKRKDGTKSFALRFIHFGEPKDRGNAINDHYFFSSSPTDFIPVDVPTRRVYMCVLDQYENALTAAAREARRRVLQLSSRIQVVLSTQELDVELKQQLDIIRNEFIASYLDGVQLEATDYVIELVYEYRESKSHKSPTRTATATVEFTVTQSPKDVVRAGLVGFVNSLVLDAAGKQHPPFVFPAITPEKVTPMPVSQDQRG